MNAEEKLACVIEYLIMPDEWDGGTVGVYEWIGDTVAVARGIYGRPSLDTYPQNELLAWFDRAVQFQLEDDPGAEDPDADGHVHPGSGAFLESAPNHG